MLHSEMSMPKLAKVNMESLLGEFFTRIKGSQEDIASTGLVYILDRSVPARTSIRNLIKNDLGAELPDMRYHVQQVGHSLERPDVTGTDEKGQERLIIEAKFWAALTENQPVEYLKRLKDEGGVLLFVCPELRVHTLWDELARRLQNAGIKVLLDENSLVATTDTGIRIGIKSWDKVLAVVKDALVQAGVSTHISDIDQIIGFCSKIDDTAFLPFTDQDMSPALGKRIYSYYGLMDNTLQVLKRKMDIGGYARYFATPGLGCSFSLNFKFWYEQAQTPFWLQIVEAGDGTWKSTPALLAACRATARTQQRKLILMNDKYPHFALFPPMNEPEGVILESMANDAKEIINSVLAALELTKDLSISEADHQPVVPD